MSLWLSLMSRSASASRGAGVAQRRLAASALLGALLLFGAPPTSRAGELECMIEPKETVSISAHVEAVIDEILVDRGSRVSKGDVLVELQADVQRASLEIARLRAVAKAPLKSQQVRLSYAELVLGRNEDLHHRNVASLTELDQARSAKELAEVGILEAQEQRKLDLLEVERSESILALYTLRSPIDAVVMDRMLSVGERAEEQEILRLAQVDPLYVEVFAPVSSWGKIAVGTAVEVFPEEPVAGPHRATVVVVDPAIDAASGTFRVRLELPNPDYAIPAGLECMARFPDSGADATPLASVGLETDL